MNPCFYLGGHTQSRRLFGQLDELWSNLEGQHVNKIGSNQINSLSNGPVLQSVFKSLEIYDHGMLWCTRYSQSFLKKKKNIFREDSYTQSCSMFSKKNFKRLGGKKYKQKLQIVF